MVARDEEILEYREAYKELRKLEDKFKKLTFSQWVHLYAERLREMSAIVMSFGKGS